MVILTSYTSATYFAQIRSAREVGFKQLYTGTCTESPEAAAKNLVRKWFGEHAANSVTQIKDGVEIHMLVGDFFKDPKRKQVFDVWTFNPAANPPAKVVTKEEFKSIVEAATGTKPAATPEVTTESPKDPAWDRAREVSEQLRTVGRLFLRGQVKLGMILSGLKKELGIRNGKGLRTSADSAEVITWPDLVKRETGYSRRQSDEFIRLYEATKNKLKVSKKLDLPAPVKADALALFRAENPLTLTDEQWTLVDQVIGTLTTGETQASLMQELGILPQPKPMPKGGGVRKQDDQTTAGQLAFHFFEAVAAPLINARCNPDYQKLLHALPIESDEEHPLSLATLEAEFRAALADIEAVKAKAQKSARGKTITV